MPPTVCPALQHGLLPGRDKYLAAYARWLDAKLAAVDNPEQRRLVELYGRWHQLRHLRHDAANGAVGRTTFLRAKQSTTMGIDFLRWLAKRGRSFDECTQHDIDAYCGAGPSTRLHARSFLYWALNARKLRGLNIPDAPSILMPPSARTSAWRLCGISSSTTTCTCRGGSPAASCCCSDSRRRPLRH